MVKLRCPGKVNPFPISLVSRNNQVSREMQLIIIVIIRFITRFLLTIKYPLGHSVVSYLYKIPLFWDIYIFRKNSLKSECLMQLVDTRNEIQVICYLHFSLAKMPLYNKISRWVLEIFIVSPCFWDTIIYGFTFNADIKMSQTRWQGFRKTT